MRNQAHLLPQPWFHPGLRSSRVSSRPSDRLSIALVRRSFAHSGLHSGIASTIAGRPAVNVSERLIRLGFRGSLLPRTAAHFVFLRSVELVSRPLVPRETVWYSGASPDFRPAEPIKVGRTFSVPTCSVSLPGLPGTTGPSEFLLFLMRSLAFTRFCSRRHGLLGLAKPSRPIAVPNSSIDSRRSHVGPCMLRTRSWICLIQDLVLAMRSRTTWRLSSCICVLSGPQVARRRQARARIDRSCSPSLHSTERELAQGDEPCGHRRFAPRVTRVTRPFRNRTGS